MGTAVAFRATIFKASPFLSVDECQGMWRPDDACHGICLPDDDKCICLPDAECQGIFLADDECQGICLLDTVRQGISFEACHRIYFWTALASAHAAPNVCRPCVCVLDDDGHRSSLPGDEGQGKWRPDDACPCIFLLDDEFDGKLLSRRSVSREMPPGRLARAAFCTTPARLRAIIAAPGAFDKAFASNPYPRCMPCQYSHYMSYDLLGVVIHLNEIVTVNTLLSGVFPPPRDPTHPPSCNTLRSRLSNRYDC